MVKKICLLARVTFMQNKRKKKERGKESKLKKQKELEESTIIKWAEGMI